MGSQYLKAELKSVLKYEFNMAERESGFSKNVKEVSRTGLSAVAFIAGLVNLGNANLLVAAADFAISYLLWPKPKSRPQAV